MVRLVRILQVLTCVLVHATVRAIAAAVVSIRKNLKTRIGLINRRLQTEGPSVYGKDLKVYSCVRFGCMRCAVALFKNAACVS